MKALLFVLIWSSIRPLMDTKIELLPDMAACHRAAAAIQSAANEASILAGSIVTRCVSIEPDK